MEVKVRAADTNGAYALLEFTIPPGGTGSPPHYHQATEETFYVTEGKLRFRLGKQTGFAPAGSCVVVPRHVIHAFENVGSRPARLLILVSPGDFEGYFLELAALAQAGHGDPPDHEALRSIANKYGQWFEDQIPALG